MHNTMHTANIIVQLKMVKTLCVFFFLPLFCFCFLILFQASCLDMLFGKYGYYAVNANKTLIGGIPGTITFEKCFSNSV